MSDYEINVSKLKVTELQRGEEYEYWDGRKFTWSGSPAWVVRNEHNRVMSLWQAKHIAEDEVLLQQRLAQANNTPFVPTVLPDGENPTEDPCIVCGNEDVKFIILVEQMHTDVEKGNERRGRWRHYGDENFWTAFCFCELHKPAGAQVLLPDGEYFPLNTTDRRFMTTGDHGLVDGG